MQVNVIDRSFGNQVNITETYFDGIITTIGQIYGNRFNLTVTTRLNDGEELRESVTGMVREDGGQYNIQRNTISHYLPYATRQSNSDGGHWQSTNGYASMQFTQHKRSFGDSNDNNNNLGGRYW